MWTWRRRRSAGSSSIWARLSEDGNHGEPTDEDGTTRWSRGDESPLRRRSYLRCVRSLFRNSGRTGSAKSQSDGDDWTAFALRFTGSSVLKSNNSGPARVLRFHTRILFLIICRIFVHFICHMQLARFAKFNMRFFALRINTPSSAGNPVDQDAIRPPKSVGQHGRVMLDMTDVDELVFEFGHFVPGKAALRRREI
jgi:hypothetical protein